MKIFYVLSRNVARILIYLLTVHDRKKPAPNAYAPVEYLYETKSSSMRCLQHERKPSDASSTSSEIYHDLDCLVIMRSDVETSFSMIQQSMIYEYVAYFVYVK